MSGVAKDTFSLWLNQNIAIGEMIADFVLKNAEKRLRVSEKIG